MKIAVIGAGPSGLCTAKELLLAGFDVSIFEKSSSVGGVFANVYKELQLVNNNLLISFSDFPYRASDPNLSMMPAYDYVKYLEAYAAHFQVTAHIKFNTLVHSAQKKKNQWELEIHQTGRQYQEVFDFLVVCSGTHQHPACEPIDGEESFLGDIIHSNKLRHLSQYQNKKILVVGMGEYGSDITHLLSELGAQVDVSIRRQPGYIIPRYIDNKPTDLDTSRLHHSLAKYINHTSLPALLKLKRGVEKMLIRNQYDKAIQKKIDSYNASLPDKTVFERMTTKSEGFIKATLHNGIGHRPSIKKILPNSVLFSDGRSDHYDTIILCTGYKSLCSFLAKPLNTLLNGSRNLYKYMLPIEEKQIAFIGFVRPGVGSIPPMSEMQARYLSLILQNKLSLPSVSEQKLEIAEQIKKDIKQFSLDHKRLNNITDYLSFMDGYAKAIGCQPGNRFQHFLKNPKLWYKVHFSFLAPAQYRLYGPGANFLESKKLISRLPCVTWPVLLSALLALVLCFISKTLNSYKKILFRQ